jgi:signal transduction histidine kinase/ActR/RegA family two-component response regulator
VEGCALFLSPSEQVTIAPLELVAASGKKRVSCPVPLVTSTPNRSALCPVCYQLTTDESSFYQDIIGPEGYLGTVGIALAKERKDAPQTLRRLSFYASMVIERFRLVKNNKTLIDRNEVFRELNQLIATNADLEKMAKTIVRQATFRFGANTAMMLLVGKNGDSLDVIATHGVSKGGCPPTIPLRNSLLSRALRLGTILSIPDLKTHPEQGLEFLIQSDIHSVHCANLDVRGEPVGVLLLGYRHHDEANTVLLKEFAQGAAVALSSARTQSRLRAYAEQLEELVRLRTADLESQTQRAEEASRAKSRFVANMSHELRTPLTAIVGYSSVVSDGVFGPINEKQRDALQNITRSSAHLKELIDEVLNLSRIEAGKEDPEPSKVELHSLLQQVYKLMLQTAVGKGVQIAPMVVSEELKERKLWVDPRHIRQVLINLISNAIKYTPKGGKIEVLTEIIGDKMKITVSDTGIGITPDKLNTLFDRFERGDDRYSREQEGTGIGLAITRHLTEANGGRIGVESQPGVGSQFWILIPLAETDATRDVPLHGTEVGAEQWSHRLDGLNVLVCDDNELTCEVLEIVIREAGGSPYCASTVQDARQLAENVDMDVVLVDLAIPGESGLGLLDYLQHRSSASLAMIPTIVISACVFENDRDEAFKHGASCFIAKPFRPADVVQMIRSLTTNAALNSTGTFPVAQ